MAPLISLGGMKISSTTPEAWRAIGPHKAVAVAMQIEAAGDQVVACRRRERGNAPVLAIQLGQLAAHGQARQLLQQQAPLAPAAEAQLAHQLLVSGFAAGGAGNARDQFAIGHRSRVGQLAIVAHRRYGTYPSPRSTLPGSAPVILPSAITGTPFTST